VVHGNEGPEPPDKVADLDDGVGSPLTPDPSPQRGEGRMNAPFPSGERGE
jgi:hypothetical protein